MPEFRKKPVVIEARQLSNQNAGELVEWIEDQGGEAWMRGGSGGGSVGAVVYIRTLEGRHQADVGDFVIRGVAGEFYPCKPEIFAATYDAVQEAA